MPSLNNNCKANMYVNVLSEKSTPKMEKYLGDNFGIWAKNGISNEPIIGKGPGVNRLGLKQTKNASCIVNPSVADISV